MLNPTLLQSVESRLESSPHIRPEHLSSLGRGAEPECGQLAVNDFETGDLLVVQLAAVEDEHQRVIPRAMRRHPLDAEQLDHPKIETEFFIELPARRFVWCLVG